MTADQEIPWHEIVGMIRHWLSTPENGYLGSSYGGNTIVAKLASEGCAGTALDAVAYKLKEDVPCLSARAASVSCAVNSRQSVVLQISVDGKSESFDFKNAAS